MVAPARSHRHLLRAGRWRRRAEAPASGLRAAKSDDRSPLARCGVVRIATTDLYACHAAAAASGAIGAATAATGGSQDGRPGHCSGSGWQRLPVVRHASDAAAAQRLDLLP